MHRWIASGLLALVLAGPAAAEPRALSGFTEVHASDRLRVVVAPGAGYSVMVTGADAGRVRTRLKGEELHISDGRRPWFGTGRQLDAEVRVTMPVAHAVVAARGAELHASVAGACDDFSAVAAMGGTAEVTGLQCGLVEAAAAMGGVLRLAGACGSLDVTAAMGGEVQADELQCELVEASAAMGGDVRAYATRSYDASASMGGAINVAGEARPSDTSGVLGGSVTGGN